jgi:hypothetical protein
LAYGDQRFVDEIISEQFTVSKGQMARRAPTSTGMQVWSSAGEQSLAGEHERQKKREQEATEARKPGSDEIEENR